MKQTAEYTKQWKWPCWWDLHTCFEDWCTEHLRSSFFTFFVWFISELISFFILFKNRLISISILSKNVCISLKIFEMYQRENIFTKLFCFVFIWKKDNELQRCFNEILNIGEIPIFFVTSIRINTSLINCHGSFNFYILLNKFKILLKLKKLFKQSIRFFKKSKNRNGIQQKKSVIFWKMQKKSVESTKKIFMGR